MTNTQALFKEWVKLEHQGIQRRAAKQLGISPEYLSDILRGQRRVSENAFKRLWTSWPDRRNALTQAWANDAIARVKVRNGGKR